MTTYSEVNTAEVAAVTVDTEILVLDATIPSGKGGRIKKIAYCCTAATTSSGFLELKLGSHSGPFRWAIPDKNGGNVLQLAGEIECDIEVYANETVKGYMTLEVAGVDGHISIVWVSG